MAISKKIKISALAGIITIGLGFASYYIMSATAGYPELIKYQVTDEDSLIEVRLYPNILTASVTLEGDRESSLEQGITILNTFFEGKNNFHKVIPLHAPYFQQELDSLSCGK